MQNFINGFSFKCKFRILLFWNCRIRKFNQLFFTNDAIERIDKSLYFWKRVKNYLFAGKKKLWVDFQNFENRSEFFCPAGTKCNDTINCFVFFFEDEMVKIKYNQIFAHAFSKNQILVIFLGIIGILFISNRLDINQQH